MTDRGFSEEEAVEKFASVEKIASEILTEAGHEKLKSRSRIRIGLLVSSAVLLILCFRPLLFRIGGQITMNASIGIIGGADGPTSVFVAGRFAPPWGLYIMTAVTLTVTVICFLKKR